MPRKQLAFGIDLNDLSKAYSPAKKKTARKSMSLSLFEQVYKKCGGKCKLCGKRKKREDVTIDHIKPLSKSGSHNFSNLQILCFRCNSIKGRGTMTKAKKKLGLETPRKKHKVRRKRKKSTKSSFDFRLPTEKTIKKQQKDVEKFFRL